MHIGFEIQSGSSTSGNCSQDCGIGNFIHRLYIITILHSCCYMLLGVRRVVTNYIRHYNNSNMVVAFDNLPAGLVKPEVEFCINSNEW